MSAPSSSALVYLILGAAGSGRREILADLLEGGVDAAETVAVLVSAGESASPADAPLAAKAALSRWSATPREFHEDEPALDIEATVPPGADRLFFLSDGRLNPVDQVEAFKVWLERQSLELARILCIVDCRLAEAHPPLHGWYDACIHFADVVLLTHREGVANKWVSDFRSRFEHERYPCLFEIVKHGSVRNPALVLEPQARRMSHIFDDEMNWTVLDSGGNRLDADDDVAEEGEDEEEVEVQLEVDPYLERRNGGRRVKEIPDIAKYIPAAPAPP